MKELEEKIKAFCGSKIIQGPLKGLHLDPIERYGPAHVILKWLGTYEQVLHRHLNYELHQNHDAFISFGCGDGYYGAGFKSRNPEADVVFVDIDQTCEAEVQRTCAANGITEYDFFLHLSCENIHRILGAYSNPWIFVDIEGAEVDVLDPQNAPGLTNATITVEMHDCFRMGVTNELIARFENTHKILNIVDDWKKVLPALSNEIQLSGEVLDFIKYERRCTRMNWLHMTPLKGV